MQCETNRPGRADIALVTLILLGTVLYLCMLPHSLGPADESIHLYDAKRLLGGAVMYRDVFNDITPGWMLLMAGLFRLFGVNVTVARTAAAVIHGFAAVGIYAAARGVGVRPSLSWPAALIYVVVCQSAWPIASQHWLSTLLSVVVLWLCVRYLREPRRWTLMLGVVLGLFVGVQQQRAAIAIAGVAVWLVLDHLLDRCYGIVRSLRSLVVALGGVAIGIGIVAVPLFTWIIARAGFARVWRALIIFPLFDYAGVTHCPWGDVNAMTAWQASFTFVPLLKYLPVVVIPSLARLSWQAVRAEGRDEARQLLLLGISCATAALSIMYFPDFIHIAFIAPVFLVTAVENVEWAARRTPVPPPLRRAAGIAVGAGLLLVCGVHLVHNSTRLRQEYPFSRSTAFGRVDFRTETEALVYDEMKELMQGTPSRYLYCYPTMAYLYLMLDVENPTAHGFFVPGYSGPDLVQEVLDSLAATRPPYIVYLAALAKPGDPVGNWITEHYEPIGDAGPVASLIFRRKQG